MPAQPDPDAGTSPAPTPPVQLQLPLELIAESTRTDGDRRPWWFSPLANCAYQASKFRCRPSLVSFVDWNLARMGAVGWHDLSNAQVAAALAIKYERNVRRYFEKAIERGYLRRFFRPGRRAVTRPGPFIEAHAPPDENVGRGDLDRRGERRSGSPGGEAIWIAGGRGDLDRRGERRSGSPPSVELSLDTSSHSPSVRSPHRRRPHHDDANASATSATQRRLRACPSCGVRRCGWNAESDDWHALCVPCAAAGRAEAEAIRRRQACRSCASLAYTWTAGDVCSQCEPDR